MDELLEWLNIERGRRVRLAEGLGINPGALSQWQGVPAERVLRVEELTGISRYRLRPDIFGKEPERVPVNERAEARQ